MFCISHDRDIAPLDGEPVGQTENRDGGAVGPAGIQLEYSYDECYSVTVLSECLYLDSEGCDVLSLVYVVVQAGGQGQEAVGGDEEFLHHVSIERK